MSFLKDPHPQVELTAPFANPAPSSHGIASESTYNWSGYASSAPSAGTYTAVTGLWTTPALSCTAEDTLTSEWVGIDGFSSTTVEQDGTMGWCFGGRPSYFTWYEMYPSGTVEVGKSLQPGDRITASVSRTGSQYTLSVTDASRAADSFRTVANCPATTCRDTSVEWVSERPAFSIGTTPLADYGAWTVSGASETANGRAGAITSSPATYELTMMDATQTYPLATPSALAAGGSGFATTWRNSY